MAHGQRIRGKMNLLQMVRDYSMINGLDTEYFAAGASDYTSKCYNRWIVADSAYRVDTLEQFKLDSEVWKKDKIYHPIIDIHHIMQIHIIQQENCVHLLTSCMS